MSADRRGFLKIVSHGAWAVCLGGFALIGERFLRPPGKVDLSRRVSLGPLSKLPPGGSKHLKKHDVYVFHGAQGLYALSGRCTHLGCSVLRTPEGFACPCHGARFDLQGAPLTGPATTPLVRLEIEVDGRQQIRVHLDRPIEPGARGRI